jgi:hypothetical protein
MEVSTQSFASDSATPEVKVSYEIFLTRWLGIRKLLKMGIPEHNMSSELFFF